MMVDTKSQVGNVYVTVDKRSRVSDTLDIQQIGQSPINSASVRALSGRGSKAKVNDKTVVTSERSSI